MSNRQFTKDCTVTEAPVTTDTYARFIDFYGDAPRSMYHWLCEAGKWADGCKRQVFYGSDPKPEQFDKLMSLGKQLSRAELDGNLVPSLRSSQLEECKPALRRIHAYLGILSELAELALPDLLAFRRWANEPADVPHLTFEEVERYTYEELGLNPEVSRMEEGGDICWYLGILLAACQKEGTVPLTIESLCNFVIAKLKVRYKDKFDKAETEQRNVQLELQKGMEEVRQRGIEAARRGLEAAAQIWPDEVQPEDTTAEPVDDPMAKIEEQWRKLFKTWVEPGTMAAFHENVSFILTHNTPAQIQTKVTQVEKQWAKVTNLTHEVEAVAALRHDVLALFAHISNQRDRIAELTSRLDARTGES